MLRLDVKAVDVVQPAIPGLRHHRQRPRVSLGIGAAVSEAPPDHGIAHHAHAVGVGDHHRPLEIAGLLDPGGAGHLAVAVLREPAGEYRICQRIAAARQHGGDPRAHRALADLKLARARNQRGMPDQHARHVGDGVEGPRCAVERDAQIPRAGHRRRRRRSGRSRSAGSRRTTGRRIRCEPTAPGDHDGIRSDPTLHARSLPSRPRRPHNPPASLEARSRGATQW